MDLQTWRESGNREGRNCTLEDSIDTLRQVFDCRVKASQKFNHLGVSMLFYLESKPYTILLQWLTETKYDAYIRYEDFTIRRYDPIVDKSPEYIVICFFPKGTTYQEIEENCGYVMFDK
jgi:hypothetical protein